MARYRSPNGPHLLLMVQPIRSPEILEPPWSVLDTWPHGPENPGYRSQVWDKMPQWCERNSLFLVCMFTWFYLENAIRNRPNNSGSLCHVVEPPELLRLHLTHWGRDKMATIFLATFWNAFSWMKMYEIRLRFHWNVFGRFELTIFHHWFN